ncbi:hypothetical protein DFP73DRAFT_478447 [Morchella snyderi]|nr:hypothetical protein DFP73DRAFT_478447 [Morchella snyderi]
MSPSTVPSHQYHPPRHPHAISPTTAKPPTTPPSFATGYVYPSSTSAVPTTAYRSTGPPSIISTSSSPSPRLNPGLAAARHVSKAASILKRSRSDNAKKSSEQLADDVIDEGFFSGPGSPPLEQHYPHHSATSAHKARGKIKPLLKKVSGSSRGNSLDLSRSDGGLPGGVGLGIFDNAGDSSGVDEDSPYSNRHRRNFSGTSGNSPLLVNAPFAHPKRQVPRRGAYTPEVSHYNTSNESSDGSDDESITRRKVLQGSSGGNRSIRRGLHLNTGGRSTPMLPTSSLTDLHNRRISTSTLTTPVSPVSPLELPPIRSSTLESVVTIPQQPSPTGSRAPSLMRSRIGRTSSETTRRAVRDPSPGFAASVTAARLAWEAKEEKKEEKRERKRRRSEAKGEERSRATSRCSGRERGNSDGSKGTVWDDDELPNSFPEKVLEEDCTEERGRPRVQGAGTGTGGKRWSVGKDRRPGFKKRWLGFVVWVRIGMVRMGRRLGF